EKLRRILPMRHDPVECGKVPVAGIHAAGTEKGLESRLANPDVQTEHARTVEMGEAVIVAVGIGQRGEWQHAVRANEKELIAKVVSGLDSGEGAGDVLDDGSLVRRRSHLPR